MFWKVKPIEILLFGHKEVHQHLLIPPSITKEPAYKKVETQRRFYSAARKRLRAKPLSKPTSPEKNTLLNSLDGDVQYAIAGRLHDHDYQLKLYK